MPCLMKNVKNEGGQKYRGLLAMLLLKLNSSQKRFDFTRFFLLFDYVSVFDK